MATQKTNRKNATSKSAGKGSGTNNSPAPKANNGYKFPARHYTAAPAAKQVAPRPNTLRAVAHGLLTRKGGATYAEIIKAADEWYTNNPNKARRSGKDLDARVHELIKLVGPVRNGNGYGLKTDPKTHKITAYTK